MADLTILVEGPVTADGVRVAWRDTGTIGAVAQHYIDARWTEYLAAAEASGSSLFNAPVTRLINVQRDAEKVLLTLGETDYKTFIVTVLRDRAWFEANAPEAMMRALGNSVLLTRDDRALLGIRSGRTSAYGGRAHLIGGVLDLLERGHRIAAGIIAHLRRELYEEAGIVDAELTGLPVLIAVAQDQFLRQPELIWQWEMRGDLEVVGKRLEASEHDGFIVVGRQDLSKELWERMTPVAREAWTRWRGG